MNRHLFLLPGDVPHSPRDAVCLGDQFKEYYAYCPMTQQLTHCVVVDFLLGHPPTSVVTKSCQLVNFLLGLLASQGVLHIYTSPALTPKTSDWQWAFLLAQFPSSLQNQALLCNALIKRSEEVLAREMLYVDMEIKALKTARSLVYDEIQRNTQERERCRTEILHQLEKLQATWHTLLTQERLPA